MISETIIYNKLYFILAKQKQKILPLAIARQPNIYNTYTYLYIEIRNKIKKIAEEIKSTFFLEAYISAKQSADQTTTIQKAQQIDSLRYCI